MSIPTTKLSISDLPHYYYKLEFNLFFVMTKDVMLVTGATRGVGRGIARVLGKTGATVYITGRSVDPNATTQGLPGTLKEVGEEIEKNGGVAIPVRSDHTNNSEVRSLVKRIESDEGHLDLLVNNVFGGEEGKKEISSLKEHPFWEHDMKEWWYRMFTAYLRAHINTSLYAIPLMFKSKRGLIVSTLWWNRGKYLDDLFFDVSSAGVSRMVYDLSIELEGKNVYSVALSPGWTLTERMPNLTEDQLKQTHSPDYVGIAVSNLYMDKNIGSLNGQTLEIGSLARRYGFTDIDGKIVDYHERIN